MDGKVYYKYIPVILVLSKLFYIICIIIYCYSYFRLILTPRREVIHSNFKAYEVNGDGKEKTIHLGIQSRLYTMCSKKYIFIIIYLIITMYMYIYI